MDHLNNVTGEKSVADVPNHADVVRARVGRLSVRTKIALIVASLFLLLVLLVSAIQLHYVKAEMQTLLAEQQHGFVARVAKELDQKLMVNLNFLDAGTRTIPAEAYGDLGRLQTWAAQRQGLRTIFNDLFIISAKGVVLVDSPPRGRDGIDVSTQEYFRATVETRKPYISKPFLGKSSKEPVVTFSAPVIDKQGAIVAILTGSLNLTRPNFLGDLADAKVGKSGSFEVLAQDRTIVISSDKTRILEQGPALGVSSYFDHATSGLEGSDEGIDSRGLAAIFSYSQLKAVPCALVASLPVDEAYAPIRATQHTIIQVTLLLALFVAALAWFGVRRLFDPLQAALGASERRYSALFANKSNAIAHCRVITDEHGRPVDYWILQVNDAYERIIGIKRADIEGRRVTEIFPGVKNYAFDYIGVLGKVAVEGGEIMSETLFEATRQHLSIYAYSPLPGEFTAIFTDITERKRAEGALRESEERYRNLFNTMDEGFCIIEMILDAEGRPVDYRFLEINAAFENQTGLHEAKGKLMRELAPAHEAHWFEIYGRIALTGEPARFTNEAKALNRWYDVYAYRVGRAEDRQVAIIFNDISERKRSEEALRISKERLAAVIGTAMDAIITVDESQRVVLFNAAAEKIFCCNAAAAMGEPLERFLPERFRKVHRGHIQAFGATGVTSRSMHSTATINGLRFDGEEFPCEATISQATTGGQKLYTVILRDISERIKTEQLRQLAARLLEVREQERKDVAHELHENIAQYLAGVEMYVSSARSVGVAPSIEVQRFLDEGHALLRQCSADIQTMAGVLYPETLEMFGLVAAIRSHVTSLKEQDDFEVSLDITPELPRLAAVHEIALYRVMEEALTNVQTHSGANAAELRLSFDAFEVRLDVIDAGHGMTVPDGQATGHGPKGTGIVEMGERIRSLGGKFDIVSGRDGTKVKAVLPFVPRQRPQ